MPQIQPPPANDRRFEDLPRFEDWDVYAQRDWALDRLHAATLENRQLRNLLALKDQADASPE